MRSELEKAINGVDVIELLDNLMAETPEQTAQRRQDNEERREAETSEYQEELNDKGLKESDFM